MRWPKRGTTTGFSLHKRLEPAFRVPRKTVTQKKMKKKKKDLEKGMRLPFKRIELKKVLPSLWRSR